MQVMAKAAVGLTVDLPDAFARGWIFPRSAGVEYVAPYHRGAVDGR